LTYRQFAAEIGKPVTEASVKKWPQRKKFPADAARLIVSKAQERGLVGVTLEWVLWGDGPRPQKAPQAAPNRFTELSPRRDLPTARQEPHGRFPAWIAEAVQADLSHNEFGQWSSVEVQHTVLWALKDLARRLRVLRFDMGKTFELTDEWAGEIGLPVRPAERSSDEAGQTP
jgi:predicted acetyltransferase